MKRPHVKASRRLDVTDPYGRRTKMSHSIQKTYASGGAVMPRGSGRPAHRLGDTKDLYLSGKGDPWSAAYQPAKKR
jgi:hypothetical protein